MRHASVDHHPELAQEVWEGMSVLEFVEKLYIAYYQRPADPGGLIYWANRILDEGLSNHIFEAFANSQESRDV